jgi:hypothetical protein
MGRARCDHLRQQHCGLNSIARKPGAPTHDLGQNLFRRPPTALLKRHLTLLEQGIQLCFARASFIILLPFDLVQRSRSAIDQFLIKHCGLCPLPGVFKPFCLDDQRIQGSHSFLTVHKFSERNRQFLFERAAARRKIQGASHISHRAAQITVLFTVRAVRDGFLGKRDALLTWCNAVVCVQLRNALVYSHGLGTASQFEQRGGCADTHARPGSLRAQARCPLCQWRTIG